MVVVVVVVVVKCLLLLLLLRAAAMGAIARAAAGLKAAEIATRPVGMPRIGAAMVLWSAWGLRARSEWFLCL